jgi:hypothetical protein
MQRAPSGGWRMMTGPTGRWAAPILRPQWPRRLHPFHHFYPFHLWPPRSPPRSPRGRGCAQ